MVPSAGRALNAARRRRLSVDAGDADEFVGDVEVCVVGKDVTRATECEVVVDLHTVARAFRQVDTNFEGLVGTDFRLAAPGRDPSSC